MDEQNRKAPAFPISGIFMILAVLGVVVLTRTPLKETRPAIPGLKEQSQQVRARLWQDPFRAVLESRSATTEGTAAGDQVRAAVGSFQLDRLADRINSSGTGTITVLGVMVYGGPYIDDSEHRIRMRYAVLAGLRRLGYYPQSPDYLDYIRTDGGDGSPLSFRNMLPFEWLERLRGKGERVLVLWINEDVLQDRPLERLTAGFTAMKRKLSGKQALKAVKIIGPAGSTTMIDLFRELTQTRGPRRLDARQESGIALYSPSATVDISLMREFDGIEELRRRDFDAPYRELVIRFSRTINTDSELSNEILRELSLRNIDVGQRNCAGPDDVGGTGNACDHIVLISEWDTFYGRMLPRTFRHAAALYSNTTPTDVDTWTHRFNYLRGMDGALPGEQSPKPDKAPDAKAADLDLQSTAPNLEQATGRSQYDYLRRLADGIYRFDAKLRRRGMGSIKAVGILGSDFYDKYLVLQAVKQRLPDAVYFTTDLDARFLQQDYLKWTRNMIVASTYGLALPYLFDAKLPPARDNLLQGEVPPFRDSYQTSVFLTTMSAFDERYHKEIQKQKPRIFEIGRQQAYELTGDAAGEQAAPPPASTLWSDMRFLMKCTVILSAATLLLVLSSSRVRDAMLNLLQQIRTHPAGTAACAAMIMLLAALFYLFVATAPDQEPVTLFDGISIWATEIIRLFAAALSLYLIRRANRDLQGNVETIDREFQLSVITAATAASAAGAARQGDVTPGKNREGRTSGHGQRERSRPESMQQLWQRYVTMSAAIPRNGRISAYIVACIALAAALMWTFGWPTTPVRGTLSLWIDKLVLLMSIGSFLYLTFLVVDASRLCRDFIRTAAAETPPWRQGGTGWTEEEEWRTLRLIGRRSEAVGKLIFYPLAVWFLLFLSRLRFFDNWNTPLHLAAIITLSAVYAWSCAYRLRKAAELARAEALERLTARMVGLRTGTEANIPLAEQVRFIINEVANMRQGAFASYMQSPTVQALLVPFGGVGGITLIDMFTKMNL